VQQTPPPAQKPSTIRDRGAFWWKALGRGLASINALAGWAGTIILALSAAAGIVVPVVFPVPPWFTAVVLVALLVIVMAEGSYQVWGDIDEKRRNAEAQRDAAQLAAQGKQANVLDLQAAQLRQAAADRRLAQASRVVFHRLELAAEPRVNQAQAAGGVHRPMCLIAHIENASDRPISGLEITWLEANQGPVQEPHPPGGHALLMRQGKADDVLVLPHGADVTQYTAKLRFQDANEVWWELTPGGYPREV
jgi:hypothetical protein